MWACHSGKMRWRWFLGISMVINDDYTREILKCLVSQGYSGDDLLEKFVEQRTNIKEVIGTLIDEADEIAAGKRYFVAIKMKGRRLHEHVLGYHYRAANNKA